MLIAKEGVGLLRHIDGPRSMGPRVRGDDSLNACLRMYTLTQFPVCNSPNRSQVLPLKRMNCIWSTGT